MSNSTSEHGPCPFVLGDRVDHRIFGFGKVASEPVPMSGPIEDKSALGGYRNGPKGWSMEIMWEDESCGTSSVSSRGLTLVERPDAQGGAYWELEYQKLLTRARQDRNETNAAMELAFRNQREERIDAASLRMRLAGEQAAIQAVLEFLDADEAGMHP